MPHFPSSLQNGGSSGLPRRTDSLNATQQKSSSHQIFLTIEQELHDARRVGSHGQEEDLRSALNMVINRVTELSSLLSEAYKSQAELELQLNVAKSNLQLVIANNEMLEEALKSGGGRDVGWRRASGTAASRSGSGDAVDRPVSLDPSFSPGSTHPNESPTDGAGGSRFFKTFFNGRPGTPTQQQPNLTSPSLPSLHGGADDDALGAALQAARASAEKARQEAERERRAADAARAEAEAATRDKVALEAEIESLSQALFEEANRMVASERMRRAEAEGELAKLRPLTEELKRTRIELREEVREARETREELREAQEEKAALRSALRLIEGENVELRTSSRLSLTHGSQSSLSLSHGSPPSSPDRITRSRSSSEVGTKSPVRSPEASPNLPFAPSPYRSSAPSPQSSPYLPTASPRLPPPSPHLSASSEDEEEELTFAPTGLRGPQDDADEEARPTPRWGPLAGLPLDSDYSRTSSPALSPPPTALAPAPADPWASG
ncbi:hypothetical protein DFH09DRAFT_1362081 [Mycena vulgaris]|nr:hypothetical protein DFH09DRAFT_1362081 [Mycena vulgaris]